MLSLTAGLAAGGVVSVKQNSEDRRQKTEDRIQKTEYGIRNTEYGRQNSEPGCQAPNSKLQTPNPSLDLSGAGRIAGKKFWDGTEAIPPIVRQRCESDP